MYNPIVLTIAVTFSHYFVDFISAGGNPLLQGGNGRSRNPLLQGPTDYSQSSNPLLKKNGLQLNGQSFVQVIQSFGTGTGFVNNPVNNVGLPTTPVFVVGTTAAPAPPPEEAETSGSQEGVTSGSQEGATSASLPPEDTPSVPGSTNDFFATEVTTMALDSPMKPQVLPTKQNVAGSQSVPASQSKSIPSTAVKQPTSGAAKTVSKSQDLTTANASNGNSRSNIQTQAANTSGSNSQSGPNGFNQTSSSKSNGNGNSTLKKGQNPIQGTGKEVQAPKNPFVLSNTP